MYVDEGVSFVMADIPGIIEGASEGAGLGHDFLRHIDRCRLLIHLVDVSGSEGRDPVEDFDAINAELREYNPELAERPQIVAANKCDLRGDDRENIDRLRARAEELGYEFFEMSAVTRSSICQGLRGRDSGAAPGLAEKDLCRTNTGLSDKGTPCYRPATVNASRWNTAFRQPAASASALTASSCF